MKRVITVMGFVIGAGMLVITMITLDIDTPGGAILAGAGIGVAMGVLASGLFLGYLTWAERRAMKEERARRQAQGQRQMPVVIVREVEQAVYPQRRAIPARPYYRLESGNGDGA